MNIKSINKSIEKLLESDIIFQPDDFFTSVDYDRIALEIRNGNYNGTIGLKDWGIDVEVVGKEGNDGSLVDLPEIMRNETLETIADYVENGNVEDSIQLELIPNNLGDKLSVESALNDHPELVSKINDCYYWTVRFVISGTEL